MPCPHNFQPIRLLHRGCCYIFTYSVVNGADPDQLASSGTAKLQGRVHCKVIGSKLDTALSTRFYLHLDLEKFSVESLRFWSHNTTFILEWTMFWRGSCVVGNVQGNQATEQRLCCYHNHHNLLIILLLQSKAKSMLAKQPYCIQ